MFVSQTHTHINIHTYIHAGLTIDLTTSSGAGGRQLDFDMSVIGRRCLDLRCRNTYRESPESNLWLLKAQTDLSQLEDASKLDVTQFLTNFTSGLGLHYFAGTVLEWVVQV